MRKLILSFLLVLIPLFGYCQHRTVGEAKALAERFADKLKSGRSSIRQRLATVVLPVDSLCLSMVDVENRSMAKKRTAARNDKPFYVFNDSLNGHFVIVSGDERMPEILGYSTDGIFECSSMPDAQKMLLAQYIDEYEWLQTEAENVPVYEPMNDIRPVAPLLTTKWDQRTPYNNLLPRVHGQRPPTGCVATAMAQIMNYYKYPERGLGQNSTLYEDEVIFQDFSATTFDWASMRDDYNEGEYSDSEADAVATLMRCCGVASNIIYESTGSLGATSDMFYALKNNFLYNTNMVICKKDYYSNEEWCSIIYEELYAGRPVYYDGDHEYLGVGHAFVLDGCDENGLFHMNMGWSGVGNGYYFISDVHGFNYDNSMVIHIAPETFGEPEYVYYANKFRPSNYYIHKDSTVDFEISGITSASAPSRYIKVSLSLYDEQFEYLKDLYSVNVLIRDIINSANLKFVPSEAQLEEGKTYYVAPSYFSPNKPHRIRTLKAETDFCEIRLSDGIVHINEKNSFTYDDVHYRILNDSCVEVIGAYPERATISVPEFVTHKGLKYSVTTIKEKAFMGCSGLTSLEIPGSVKNVGWGIVEGCPNLSRIVVSNKNKVYDSRKNCNAIIETASNALVAGCRSTAIPNSVTSIDTAAFRGCTSLTSINIPNGINRIGRGAFSGCSALTSVKIPQSVTIISGAAFSGCSSLVSVNIPDSVKYIEFSTFEGCSALASINLPSKLTGIDNAAFKNCYSLTFLAVPNDVEIIGSSAFENCIGLTSVTFSNNNTVLGNYAFRGCTGLTSVTLPDSVGMYAFEKCSGLTLITIPATATDVCQYSFMYCDSLKNIYAFPTTPVTCGSMAFSVYYDATLYVPVGCEAVYASTSPWSNFKSIKTIPTGIDDVFDDDDNANAPIYNLNGVRIQNTGNLPRGFYLRNGKIHYVR